ncbi:hypothetical protein CDZ96_25130 [Mameliella alba]|nr:hypothetical protein CDZ96_25130 [Mameliella alba]
MRQGKCRKCLSAFVVDMHLQRPLGVDDLLVNAGETKGNAARSMNRVKQPLVAGAQPILQAKGMPVQLAEPELHLGDLGQVGEILSRGFWRVFPM